MKYYRSISHIWFEQVFGLCNDLRRPIDGQVHTGLILSVPDTHAIILGTERTCNRFMVQSQITISVHYSTRCSYQRKG